MDHQKLPPSFQPRRIVKRPSARGAKRVGNGALPILHRDKDSLRSPLPRQTGAPRSAQADYENNFPPSFYPRSSPARSIPAAQNMPHISTQNEAPRLTDPAKQPLQTGMKSRKPFTVKRFLLLALTLIVVCVIAVGSWGFYLYQHGANQMRTLEALSGAANTPGTTYLIAGSDQRHGTAAEDIPGQRSDTIMLLHIPDTGTPALISIPRDTYAEIPGHGGNKINAAFSIGGAKLLVQTVELLSGLTIDHYIEIGMDGVVQLTDAVGGINLCFDRDVEDPYSELKWTAGCHDADGHTALAFSRMRYQDPEGDIGRAKRQRQVVSKILEKAVSKETIFNPFRQKHLVEAGASILTVDQTDSLWDVGMAALSLKKATSSGGVTGTPQLAV
ncbi:LCP family protein [Arcanobacterium hippocoleae]